MGIGMTTTRILKWAGLVIVIVLRGLCRLPPGWDGDRGEGRAAVAKIGLTPNQIAANGPLPGDVSLYAKELACQQKIPTPGYYSSLNGAEISDSERSGIVPLRHLPRLVRRPERGVRLAQRRRLSGHRLHQQPQAGRAVHRRRRGTLARRPDAGRAVPRQGRRHHRQGDLAHLLRQRRTRRAGTSATPT